MKQDLKRAEILRSKIKLDLLFKEGNSISNFPLKALYKEVEAGEEEEGYQIGFSAPKRQFKRAVDRNLIKRRMREAFRKNKHIILDKKIKTGEQLLIFIIYIGNKELSFQDIEHKIVLILRELKVHYEQGS